MKTCTFEGCKRKYCAKGYCKVHYNILKKEGVIRPINKRGFKIGRRINIKPPRICSIEGCGRKHEAKGLCKSHWSQQHYKRPISDIQTRNKNSSKICSVIDCKQLSRSYGYCQKHYQRWRNNGTTDLIPREVARKKCKYLGCNTSKHNGGYCFKHYRIVILQVPVKPRGGHNKKPKVRCNINNCDNFARAKGLCDKHYQRFRKHGDPLTCYRRPRKSQYISIDNILKDKGTYSKADDAEVLRENFSDIYNRYDKSESCY